MIISPWSAATWTRFTRSPLWRTRRIAWVFKPLHCLSFAIYSALLCDDKKAPRADKHSFDGTGGISLLLFARDNKTKQLSYSLGGSFCLSDFCISRALKSTAKVIFPRRRTFVAYPIYPSHEVCLQIEEFASFSPPAVRSRATGWKRALNNLMTFSSTLALQSSTYLPEPGGVNDSNEKRANWVIASNLHLSCSHAMHS